MSRLGGVLVVVVVVLALAAPAGASADTPAISAHDTEVYAGNHSVVVPLTLSPAVPAGGAAVQYRTEDGSAHAGIDYVGTSAGMVFIPGTTTASVRIALIDDGVQEPDKTFSLIIEKPTRATVATPRVTVTLHDVPDVAPAVTIDDTTVHEGPGAVAHFPVRLSQAVTHPVSVDYATIASTADKADFTPTFGALTFAPGETVKTVDVPIADDHAFEPTEAFAMRLALPSGVTIADSSAVGTIVDDDPAPCVVPVLKGTTLATAKRRLRHNHCAVGSVRYRTVRTGRAGRVRSASARPGAVLTRGARVKLVLSRAAPRGQARP